MLGCSCSAVSGIALFVAIYTSIASVFFFLKGKEFVARHLVLMPFLHIVGVFDFIIGLIIPYKYDDPDLPEKNAKLTDLSDKKDPSSPYRSTLASELTRLTDKNTNIYLEFAKAARKYWYNQTLGTREVLSIDDEKQPNGKVFKKLSLGGYKWTTYENALSRVDNLANGLLNLGLKSDQKIVLFAETRPEWLISALACFKIKVPVVTLYSTLGIDALTFGINQTETSYLITSGEQLPKLQKIIHKIPTVTHLIVIADKFSQKNLLEFKNSITSTTKVFTIEEVEKFGVESDKVEAYTRPTAKDLAIIMYTSGSTGNPKGVMINHGNLLVSLQALIKRLGTLKIDGYIRRDCYIAYLPLAHVLELSAEIGCLINGVKIAFSSPQTISDTSTSIKRGQKGDLRVLKPTIMAAVPVVLERLSKTVIEKISKTGWFTQLLFKMFYDYKLNAYRAGRSTRLLDRIFFKRISRAVVGGKLRLMLSGGAILSKEVHEFIQVCLCPVMQAYGLTETCAGGTSQLPNQTENGVVGSVVPACEIRLVDWIEGGYRNTDTPNPRGEIYIGGDNVAMGYWNMPEKTDEDFKVIDGLRYFATGDIGEMVTKYGNLKIIDRKKDIVKLSGGEYVSLNKVESVLKLLSFVDNCCVIAIGSKSNCICIISPNHAKIIDLLKEEGDAEVSKVNELGGINEKAKELNRLIEKNKNLIAKLEKETVAHCLKQGLQRFESPTKLKFVSEIWLPDTGLVTDSLKLKRKAVENFYKNEIEAVYQ